MASSVRDCASQSPRAAIDPSNCAGRPLIPRALRFGRRNSGSAATTFWRLKSRPGRPPIPEQLQVLIRRMAAENPSWGEERIANELLLKLGIRVSPRTVRKYSSYRPPGRPRSDLRWSTFLRLQGQGIIACDFLVVVTASFRLLYVFVLIEHHSRRLVNYNVTARPSSA